MGITFVDELPARKAGAGRKSTIDPIVEELKKNPGVWAHIDGVSPKSLPSFAKRHAGTAEFALRDGKMFARAVVTEAAKVTQGEDTPRRRRSRSSAS